jgi:hypothetical protein
MTNNTNSTSNSTNNTNTNSTSNDPNNNSTNNSTNNNTQNTNSSSNNQTNSTQNNTSSNSTDTNSTNNDTTKDIIDKCNNINTDNAIAQIENLRKIDYSDLSVLENFAKSTNDLTNKFLNLLSWSRDESPDSNKQLNIIYKNLKNFLISANNFGKKVNDQAQSRRFITINNKIKIIGKLMKLAKDLQYKINYNTIKQNWVAVNNKDSKNYPSRVF